MGADDIPPPGILGLRARNPNQVVDPNGMAGGGGGPPVPLPSPRGLDLRARTPSPHRNPGAMLEEEESKENALEGPYSRIGMVIECVFWRFPSFFPEKCRVCSTPSICI